MARQITSAPVAVTGTRLDSLLPAQTGSGSRGAVEYIIANTGSAVVYVAAAALETPTASAIPVGATGTIGPYDWPGPQPYLVFAAGGSALVTPLVTGVP